MSERSSGHLRTADGEVRFTRQGSGPALLLIHGLMGSERWWAKNVDAFAREFLTITVDLNGFGSNRSQRFVPNATVRSLVALLDELGVDRAHVTGHSMGGLIAEGMAASFPDRINRLILVDAAVLEFQPGLFGFAKGIVKESFQTSVRFLPTLLRDAWRSHPRAVAAATLSLWESIWIERLAQIECGTLVIWGEDDQLVPVAIGRSIAQAIPGSQLEIIAGAGHNPMWDRPEEFNSLVIEFLDEGNRK